MKGLYLSEHPSWQNEWTDDALAKQFLRAIELLNSNETFFCIFETLLWYILDYFVQGGVQEISPFFPFQKLFILAETTDKLILAPIGNLNSIDAQL